VLSLHLSCSRPHILKTFFFSSLADVLVFINYHITNPFLYLLYLFPSYLKVRYKPTKAGYITALPREVVFFGRVMTSVRRNCEGEQLLLCIVPLSLLGRM